LGIVEEDETTTLINDGTVIIVPHEQYRPGIKTVYLPRVGQYGDFVLEMRENYGFDSDIDDTNGIYLRIIDGPFTDLINANAEEDASGLRPLIYDGEAFYDQLSNIMISVNVINDESTEVSVDFGFDPLDEISPGIEIIKPIESTWIRIGDTVSVEVEARDAGTVENIEIYIDENLVAECSGEGVISSCEHEWNTENLAELEHTIRAVAVDPSGNVGEISHNVYTSVDIKNGWPKEIPYFFDGIINADVDKSVAGREYIFSYNTSAELTNFSFEPMGGWPVNIPGDWASEYQASYARSQGNHYLAYESNSNISILTPSGSNVRHNNKAFLHDSCTNYVLSHEI